MKIGFITSTATELSKYFPTAAEPNFISSEPLFTPDDLLAAEELRKHGHQVEPIIWGTPVDTLHNFDLVVVRSPWDCTSNEKIKQQFFQWICNLEQANIPVANPSHFMYWLLDKHYLEDLKKEGVSVIPTLYHQAGSKLILKDIFEQKGPFVIKPCVAAAGNGLFYITTQEDAEYYQPAVNVRTQFASYMVQDFIGDIMYQGEWSLVFLGGNYSHAVHKRPGPHSIMVHAERGGSLSFTQKPSPALIEFAKGAYQKVLPAFKRATGLECDPRLILYLRLDIIDAQSGPVLVECEGVEPELFFRAQDKSKEIFRKAIAAMPMGE